MLQLLLLTLILPNYSKPDPIPRNPSDSLSTLLLQTKTNPNISFLAKNSYIDLHIMDLSHVLGYLITDRYSVGRQFNSVANLGGKATSIDTCKLSVIIKL